MGYIKPFKRQPPAWEVLGLTQEEAGDRQKIMGAFRKKMMEAHPDTAGAVNSSTDEIMRLKKARDFLIKNLDHLLSVNNRSVQCRVCSSQGVVKGRGLTPIPCPACGGKYDE